MRQEKKKEEYLPALKVAVMHRRFKNNIKNVRRKTDYSHEKQYWQHEDQQIKNN